MKIRSCFVSNSSSSSFICDVCNYVECDCDLELSNSGMALCENGHTFCFEHIVNPESFEEYTSNPNNSQYFKIPEMYCPICTVNHVSEDDILKFLEIDRNEVEKKIRETYKTYKEFKKALEEKNK